MSNVDELVELKARLSSERKDVREGAEADFSDRFYFLCLRSWPGEDIAYSLTERWYNPNGQLVGGPGYPVKHIDALLKQLED